MRPQRIEKLHVRGFKTFADAELELTSLNLLVGGNGVGKSNLLSLLKLLRALGRGDLQVYVGKSGGANDVLRRAMPSTKAIELALNLATITGECRYQLLAERTDDDRFLIQSESMDRFEPDGAYRGTETYNQPGPESPLADTAGRASEHSLFASLRVFHFAEPAVAAPASFECDIDDNLELREDGGNLAAYLYFLQQKHPKPYRMIVASVRRVLRDFGEFSLRPSALNPRRIRLRYRMKGVEGDFGAHQLSDGTMRFVLLTTLLLQPAELLPRVIAIDEPELGLHPASLHLFAGMLTSASHATQLIVTTQSAPLVDEFAPEDIVVVHRRDDVSTFERLSTPLLREWLDEYSLGELWEKNVVGGGPYG